MLSSTQISADELLAHDAFVRRLARRLARDEHQADDIVQETWLAALSQDSAVRGPLRPWLAQVVGNLAADQHRSQSRRATREAWSARDEAEPGAEERAIERSARLRLVRLVLQLGEPYRTAIVLRYYEGLDAGEVAQRLEVPVDTVRTRTKRGLKLLRRRLEREPEGGRQLWAWPMLWLARLRDAGGAIVQRSREIVDRGRAAPAQVAWLVLAPLLLVAALVVSTSSRHSEPRGATVADGASARALTASASLPELAQREQRTPVSEVAADSSASTNAPELATRALSGRTLGSDGRALAGVEVAWWQPTKADSSSAEGRAISDESGHFRLAPLPATFEVDASSSDYTASSTLQATRVALDGLEDIDLYLTRPESLAGQVTDADGRPLSGVQLQVVLTREDLPSRVATARGLVYVAKSNASTCADREGAFELCDLPPGDYTLVARHPGLPRRAMRASTGVRDLAVRMPPAGTAVLEVVDEFGAPLADACAIVYAPPREREVGSTDAHGRLELVQQALGTHVFVRVGHQGHASVACGPLHIVEEHQVLRVRMCAGRAVAGRVLDAAGLPLPGARVAARAVSNPDLLAELGFRPLRELRDFDFTTTGADGEFELRDLPRDPLLVDLTPADAIDVAQTFELAPEAERLDLHLGASAPDVATLDLVVRDGATGSPITSFGCCATPRPSTLLMNNRRALFADAPAGRASWSALRPGRWWLSVEAAGYAPAMLVLDDVEAGSRLVAVELFATRDLRLEFVDRAGAPVADAALMLSNGAGLPVFAASKPEQRSSTLRTGPRGEVAIFDLPAQVVRIEVLPAGLEVPIAPLEFDLRVARAGVQRVVLDTLDQALLARTARFKLPLDWIGERVRIDIFDGRAEPCVVLDGQLGEYGISPARERRAYYHKLDERGLPCVIWSERFIGKLKPCGRAEAGRSSFTAAVPVDACRIEIRHGDAAPEVIELGADSRPALIDLRAIVRQ
jgi:RNA polymerase sigma-70 factor (ECF subfamily)